MFESQEDFINHIDNIARRQHYYSASVGGFFVEGLNTHLMPKDAVKITHAEYAALQGGQGEIVPDENGRPVLREIVYDLEWYKDDCRRYKQSLLEQSDWVASVAKETNTDIPAEWVEYRQKLRDYKNIENYPYKEKMQWPQKP